MRNLRKEGYQIGQYKAREFMAQPGLKVTQRRTYKVTTKRKHSEFITGDVLNKNFNSTGPNILWLKA